MTATELQGVADTVVRRAQRQGFVLPRQVREELTHAGQPQDLWKDVLGLLRPSLSYRQGRYYYAPVLSPRIQEEQFHQRAIQRAVRRLMRQHKRSAAQTERRRQGRIDFIQPVRVLTEDHRTFTLLSRDLSTTGMRLIARSLLGQKVRAFLPCEEPGTHSCFVVRILWTCAVGDDLFENGGVFLEVVSDKSEPLKVVAAQP